MRKNKQLEIDANTRRTSVMFAKPDILRIGHMHCIDGADPVYIDHPFMSVPNHVGQATRDFLDQSDNYFDEDGVLFPVRFDPGAGYFATKPLPIESVYDLEPAPGDGIHPCEKCGEEFCGLDPEDCVLVGDEWIDGRDGDDHEIEAHLR